MTPKYILNIGLAVESRDAVLPEGEVVLALDAAGIQIVGDHRVVPSDTEPTFVAEVRVPYATNLEPLLYALSVRLLQECIAVFNTATHEGQLYGPRAADWGPFNPEYFFLPSGRRMSEDMPQDGYCVLRTTIAPDLHPGAIGRVLQHLGSIARVDFGDGPVFVAASEIEPLEYSVMEDEA
jgi:hypothetical protein